MLRAQMKEDGDYYCSEEQFRKLKKEVEHAKAEVEFLKKLLPSEVNGGSRCFNIKGFSLKRPLRVKQPFLASVDFFACIFTEHPILLELYQFPSWDYSQHLPT